MERPRAHHFPGQRVVRISARTVHIGAVAVLLGAAQLGRAGEVGAWVWPALIGSGGAIILDDIYRWRGYLWRMAQLWVLLAKFALLYVAMSVPSLLLPCLWGALLLGSVVSHAPGSVRHYDLAQLFASKPPASKDAGET